MDSETTRIKLNYQIMLKFTLCDIYNDFLKLKKNDTIRATWTVKLPELIMLKISQ